MNHKKVRQGGSNSRQWVIVGDTYTINGQIGKKWEGTLLGHEEGG